jgi:hypothetical protein
MTSPLRRISWLIALALAFGAGYLLHMPERSTHAGGGYPAHVLALKTDAGPAMVVSDPDGSRAVVAELRPGDRVLRTSGAIAPRDAGVYIPVYTATGVAGWLLNGEEITEEISAVYTTDSQMEAGVGLVVTEAGAGALCYDDPTLQVEADHTLGAGVDLTITGSPYQAELGVWWPVTLATAETCWIYDTPGHFALAD